jgi:hypothetical protein
MTAASPEHHHNQQRGIVLIVSMVMLLAITVVGVAVMGGSRLELLMANNAHFQTDAFRNAEFALHIGLNSISTIPPSSSTSPQILPLGLTATNAADWDSFTTTPVSLPSESSGTGEYVVEYLGCSAYHYVAPSTLSIIPDTCTGDPSTTVFAYTHRVWALGTNAKGATRILHSVHTLITNLTSYPLPQSSIRLSRVEIP